ncbi:aldehyde dehydrogenase domain-containing protein [Xylariomycetidae sp. FL0641]|nr:aldehyde dehydrogenase domain-containing protein [Xylariomycetidae sp. FL0641]
MASSNMKKVTLETGGKSPAIIFDDANLKNAALWTQVGVMSNSGQMCTANSRILVQDTVYEKFLETFKEMVENGVKLGDPFDEKVSQGPQVSKRQQDRVLAYIASGEEEGAQILMGGKRTTREGKGFFVEPTVFVKVKPEMKIYREEIFGPCPLIVAFRTEQEAVQMANDTTYGLGFSVFTKDAYRGHRVARAAESGTVWINGCAMYDIHVPYGGHKQSGIGLEGGEAGLQAYYYTKAVHVPLVEAGPFGEDVS